MHVLLGERARLGEEKHALGGGAHILYDEDKSTGHICERRFWII
jgi:hypothetical protein